MDPESKTLVFRIPKELRPYEHDIRRFMAAMLHKLRKNAHKGRWEHGKVREYLVRLREEVTELDGAIDEGNMIDIILEAADVANMAMILCSMVLDGRE